MTEQLTKTALQDALKSAFQVCLASGGSVQLDLIDLREGRSSPQHEQFALTFRGPLDRFLEQGTRQVEHAAFGVFDLFLVPLAQEPDGFRYEAVFNRLLQP